jgi:putative transposase
LNVLKTCESREAATAPETGMGSYTQLTYHVVFATKYRRPTITEEFRARLYEYLGGTLCGHKGQAIEIGGVADHVHLLTRLSPTLAVSDVIRNLKAASSRWMRDLSPLNRSFEWQKGFGAFTVSYSQIPVIQKYIQNQIEHHRTRSFQEEYTALLQRHGIEFHPEQLFENEHHG